VTVEVFGGLTPNEFLDEEVGTASLILRLEKLTSLAEAYIVLTGGIGTLLEMALVWNLRLMQVSPDKPIILLGRSWKAALSCLSEHLLIRDVDLAALTLADTPEEAVAALERGDPGSRLAGPESRFSG
jgi:predicted Rossmann-fold nucleotide-binding protein